MSDAMTAPTDQPDPATGDKCPRCVAGRENGTLLGEKDRWVCGSYLRHNDDFHQSEECRIAELESALADWIGRAERQYDENVSLIARLAAVERERDAAVARLAKLEEAARAYWRITRYIAGQKPMTLNEVCDISDRFTAALAALRQ